MDALHRSRSLRRLAGVIAALVGAWIYPVVVARAGDPPGPVASAVASGDAAAASRAAVEAALGGMEDAVRAGDVDGYLAHVAAAPAEFGDGAQARFRKEQENWAKDLRVHKPVEFGLAIGPGAAAFGADRAVFELVMTYRMEVGAAKNRTVASWPAVFVRDEAGRWVYAGEDWRTLRGDNVVVKYFDGFDGVARQALEAFPIAKSHDDEGFEVRIDAPQTIKLYADMEHLKATVYLSMPDAVLGGWNEPGESIKFLARYTRGVKGWTAAFAHEYGHVCTWELGPRAGELPWWVQEGVAELAAAGLLPGYHRRTDRMIRSLAARGELPAWEEISDYRTAAAHLKHLAYHQGYHLMNHVSDRWGRSGRNRWLRAMAAGASVDEATRTVLGVSFAELDAQWRGSLSATERDGTGNNPVGSDGGHTPPTLPAPAAPDRPAPATPEPAASPD